MRRLALFILGLGLALPAAAQDPGRGKRLYETHCGGCHYARLHERPRERSRVHSLAQLRVEVAERARMVEHRFTIEDLDDLAAWLNQSHYRFER